MQAHLGWLSDSNPATAHQLLSTYYGYCMLVLLARLALIRSARRNLQADGSTRLLVLVAAAAFAIDCLPGDNLPDAGVFALLALVAILGAGVTICAVGMQRPQAGHCYLAASAWLAVPITMNVSRPVLLSATGFLAIACVLTERAMLGRARQSGDDRF
jgi:hypothetical protein